MAHFCTGSLQTTVVPFCNSEFISIAPPCRSMIFFTINSPKPDPSGCTSRAFSALKNFLNRRGLSFKLMPIPVSETLTETQPLSSFTVIATCPPRGVNLIALSTMFANAMYIFSLSALTTTSSGIKFAARARPFFWRQFHTRQLSLLQVQ